MFDFLHSWDSNPPLPDRQTPGIQLVLLLFRLPLGAHAYPNIVHPCVASNRGPNLDLVK